MTIAHLASFLAHKDEILIADGIVQICRALGVRQIAAGGTANGHVDNRLFKRLNHLSEYLDAMLYNVSDMT